MSKPRIVAASGRLEKRSMFINGRRTSIALEPVFWRAVEAEAMRLRLTTPKYIGLIDADRSEEQSLASALRCDVLTKLAVKAQR